MKYTILINQAGVVDAGLHTKTDVVDWSLLDYIFSWEGNKKVARQDNGKVWINYKHLISEMPLLGLNAKNSVANRIKKLRDLGLLETYQSPVDQRLYALTTALYYDITQFKGEIRVQSEERGVPVEERGVPVEERGVPVEERGVPVEEHSYNHQDTTIKTAYQEQTITPARERESEKQVSILNDVQREIFAWASTHEYWYKITFSEEEFLKVLCSPKGGMRQQFENRHLEKAKNPVTNGRKPKQDFTNLPDYSFDTSGGEAPSDAIDSFATTIFPQIG